LAALELAALEHESHACGVASIGAAARADPGKRQFSALVPASMRCLVTGLVRSSRPEGDETRRLFGVLARSAA
jgi:hypothetical protein